MTVSNLFERRVERLIENVVRWNRGKGADGALGELIRQQVAGELLRQPKLAVVSAALGKLGSDAAAGSLKRVVDSCSQHFYLEDRVLSVIVAPIAVRLTSREANGLQIHTPRAEDLGSLARMAEHKLSSRKVAFDCRLYDARDLYYTPVKAMFEFCQKLEAGEALPEGGPKPTVLCSTVDHQWQMVYLLGVEVCRLSDALLMDTAKAQEALKPHLYSAEWSVSEVDAVLFHNRADAEAKSHGVWYASNGLRQGENAIRGHRLESTMRNFDQGEDAVGFYYARDDVRSVIRLLITSEVMCIEFQWKLLSSSESTSGFKAELDRVIDLLVPASEVKAKVELGLDDFDTKAREEGLQW